MADTTLPYVNVASDTFDSWIAATNNAIKVLKNRSVTASNSAAGDYTYGNGFVQGILGANTIVATNIRGGNVQFSSNSSINILSNTVMSGTKVDLTGYLMIGNSTFVGSGNLASNSTSSVILDSFSTSSYRTGKYVISMTDNSANNYQSTEILVMQNGGNVFVTEYAVLVSNNNIATIAANVNSGTVRLWYTPTTSNSTVYFHKTLMTV
ncbi:MAG: hypothetical protein WCG15_00730 [Actinomycetes bacterium]|jgi:hypothetical protein